MSLQSVLFFFHLLQVSLTGMNWKHDSILMRFKRHVSIRFFYVHVKINNTHYMYTIYTYIDEEQVGRRQQTSGPGLVWNESRVTDRAHLLCR